MPEPASTIAAPIPPNLEAEAPGRIFVLYPLLMVVGLILGKMATQTDQAAPADIVTTLAVVAAAYALLLGFLRLVLGDWHKAGVGVFAAFLISMLPLDLPRYFPSWRQSWPDAGFYVRPALGLAFWALLVVGIAGIRRPLARFTHAANFISLFVVGYFLLRAIFTEYTAWANPLEVPAPQAQSASTAAPLPDIYYLIFDRYARADVLQHDFSWDNSGFLKELERRGFLVGHRSRCNYPHSMLSIWSSLNLSFLPEETSGTRVCRSIRDGHAVGRFLKERGYHYVHLGSWYDPTRRCALADENPSCPGSLTQFEMACLHTITEWQFQDWYQANHAKIAQFQLDQIEAQAGLPGPRFVFAHVQLPHDPYVFTPDGQVRYEIPSNMSKDRFVEQLQYTNARILRLVQHILDHSKQPPIIILQADEGPLETDPTRSFQDRYRGRSSILNAYHVPGLSRELVPAEVSPVNTFRLIFNHRFGTQLDLLPDHTFLWDEAPDEWRKLPEYQFRPFAADPS